MVLLLKVSACSSMIKPNLEVKASKNALQITFFNTSDSTVSFPNLSKRRKVQQGERMLLQNTNYRLNADTLIITTYSRDTLELGKDIWLSGNSENVLATTIHQDFRVRKGKSVKQNVLLDEHILNKASVVLFQHDSSKWVGEIFTGKKCRKVELIHNKALFPRH